MTILPPPALDQHIAVLGKTGSGKTYAAKGLVEHLLDAGRQVCILDPTSAWWGLRLKQDGQSTAYGLPLIGGPHADVPLSEHSGAAVARLVTEQRASVIVDLVQTGVGEYTRWFIDFAQTLFATIKRPLHLVIDEAHHFAPQGKVPDPMAGRMLHAANKLMSGGRSRGIRAMLITQRPAKLHKDSLSCADSLIAMRVIAPQDREAVKDWIDGAADAKAGREVLESLASLKRGEGWGWYPEGVYLRRVQVPKIKTFDSSATPHGDASCPAPRDIDLSAVRAAMAEAVREAEANDPKKLRSRIAELEAARPDAGIESALRERAAALQERVGALQAENDRLDASAADSLRRIAAYQTDFDRIRLIAEAGCNGIHQGPEREAPRREVMPPPASAGRKTGGSERGVDASASQLARPSPGSTTRGRAPAASTAGAGISLNGSQRRVLDALAWFESIRVPNPARDAVGLLARIKPTGGHFNNTIGPLSSAGLIEYPSGGTVALTPAGRALAEAPPRPLTLREYHEALCSVRFKAGKTREMLRAIIRCGGVMTPEALGDAVGVDPSGGHFTNCIGPLGTLGLIKRAGGKITPTEILFPERLR